MGTIRRTTKSKASFKFQPFSLRQKKILTWWMPDSGVSHMNGIIADGAIRSGKTTVMSLSFVLWAMNAFNNQNFAMCGKTIGSFRRNVLFWLLIMLRGRGYKTTYHRTDNLLVVQKGDTENYFFVFGGKDERSQDLIQGITLAGVLFDEVALMPESFVNQAIARCSVEGSKYWFNCNPEGPRHWFKVEWVDKCKSKMLLYLHFTMDDNLSLSDSIKARYRSQFVGVFYDRFIRGLWVAATGIIYQIFANNRERFRLDNATDLAEINVGVDFGGGKSGHAFVASGITRGYKSLVVLASKRYLRKDQPIEIDPDKLGELFVEFCKLIIAKYGVIHHVYCDSAEQTLIAGLRSSARKQGLAWLAGAIGDALKTSINDRIRAALHLMAQGRFFYVAENCTTLESALADAVWDPKNVTEDERLDDGTSDIDTLDAFEYTFERSISRLIRY